MPTVITTPDEITDVLFEGTMEPDTLLGRPPGPPEPPDWPTVALGVPICLGRFGVDFKMPQGTEALLKEDYYYYLVRLACSFWPPSGGKLTFASLAAFLRPKVGQERVIALDLFPKNVAQLQQGKITVEVKPGLTLEQVGQIQVGSIGTVIEYSRLEPIITGLGAHSSNPGWEFGAHAQHPLLGSKFLYLIVRKPRQAEAVRIILHVTAEVETRQGLFHAIIRDEDHLSSVICTG